MRKSKAPEQNSFHACKSGWEAKERRRENDVGSKIAFVYSLSSSVDSFHLIKSSATYSKSKYG